MSAPHDSRLDPGIVHAVTILQGNGVETFESCQGGDGHAFPEPTVRFHGNPAAGPRALSVCMDFGLPVTALRRVWYMEYGEPTGPKWELTFRPDEPASGIETEGQDAKRLGAEHESPTGEAGDAQPPVHKKEDK